MMVKYLKTKAVRFLFLTHIWYSTAVVATNAQHAPQGACVLTGGMHGLVRKSS